MNIEHMNSAIAIMLRAKEHNSIYMDFWQRKKSGQVVFTESELHACGNTACFAGHVAISDEFQKAGGTVCRYNGRPILGTYHGEEALSLWLGITYEEADSLVQGDLSRTEEGKVYSDYYNKLWYDVTADDVLIKLYELKQAYENTAAPAGDNHV